MRRIYRRLLLWGGVVAVAGLSIAAGDFTLGKNAEILFNIFRQINQLYVDPVDSDELLANAALGMTSQLDPYTEYIPAEAMDDFQVMTTGKYGGIGSLIRQSGDYVVIAQPYKGFPADKAGLQVGDKILEIDGKDAKSFTTTQISSKLKGDPGTTLRLAVEKFYSGQRVELVIRRERIAISGIPYYGFVEQGVGYIKLSDFTEGCGDDMHRALLELKRQGPLQSLIIDLRGNGGGILQEAVKILSLFLPKGTEVVNMKGRAKELDAVFKTESEPVDALVPIVLLVNNGSASASEIVCGAMQDMDRGVLLGQRTFGKGLVQTPFPLGYNAYLKITTAKYYIPSGRCIQAIDYAHRNEDGSVSHVPDSLVKEFRTAAGRRVYDGGGVMPEVKSTPEYLSRFVVMTYNMAHIEDFVDKYMKENPGLQVPLRGYTFESNEYAKFMNFMAGKDIKFESRTFAALKQLREEARRERYIDKIEALLDKIEADLPDDMDENLELYRKDITKLIEDEIIMRTHYIQGVAEHNMHQSDDVAQAVALLKDGKRYHSLLTVQQ